MQTIGLSEGAPRTESRLKSLLWPSIETGADVDYLGAQGFWVCTIIATVSAVVLAFMVNLVVAAIVFVVYFGAAIGVRERSRFAAIYILLMYAVEVVFGGLNIIRIIVLALLVANVRATWLASRWQPAPDAERPPRFSDTWTDKLADQLPMWLWPKVRIVYYVIACIFAVLVVAGIAIR